MAAPVLAAAGIAAASQAGQIYATGKTNKKTREWNEMMYGRTRQDALDDWNRQNLYNSPAAQMQRYMEAGLNPNLIYGQTQTASPIRSSDMQSWNPETPDIAGLSRSAIQGIEAYQDYTLQEEQVKNMTAQRENMLLDSLLKTVDLSSKHLENAKARELYDTSIATAKEQLRSLSTSTDIRVNQEVRDAAMHAPSLAVALQRVADLPTTSETAKQQLKNLKNDAVLKQMEINMRKLGLSYSDGVILRMLAQFAEGKSLPDLLKNLYGQLRKLGAPVSETTNVR